MRRLFRALPAVLAVAALAALFVSAARAATPPPLLAQRAAALGFAGPAAADALRDAYEAAGVDLDTERLVGLGSVCRRQATGQASSKQHAHASCMLLMIYMRDASVPQAAAGLLLEAASSGVCVRYHSNRAI
jgi:hypothetical protein